MWLGHLVWLCQDHVCARYVLCVGRTDFQFDVCVWPLICLSPTSHSACFCLWHTHTHTHTHTCLIWIWDPVHWVDRWRDNCLTPRVISAIMIHSLLQLLGGIIKRGILVWYNLTHVCVHPDSLSGWACCGMWLSTFIEQNQLCCWGTEFAYNGKTAYHYLVCIQAGSYSVKLTFCWPCIVVY
jgi:hypothetical protein